MKYNVILFTDMAGKVWHSKPLGVYRLATELRNHGYSVKVIDWFSRWLADPAKLDKLLDHLIGPNTLFIGFSTTFFSRPPKQQKLNPTTWRDVFFKEYPSVWPKSPEHLEAFTQDLQKKYPHVKLVAGGIQNFANLEYKLFERYFDYVVYGLADSTIIELANHLSKGTPIKYMSSVGKAKRITHDPSASSFDFKNSIVRYAEEDNVLPGEVLTLETSRGCLFKCDFCSFPLIGRKKGDPDYHKCTDGIFTELKENYDKYGVTKYMFVDDTFNETTEKIESVLRARDKAKIDIEFCCYLRADLLERFPNQIQLLKDLGIRSGFLGIESLNEVSARAIGKSTHPDRIKQVLYDIKDSWRGQANILGSFIIGLPGDTVETLEEWISWLEEPDNPIDAILLNYLNIIENSWPSAIAKNPEKYGYTITSSTSNSPNKGADWKNNYWTSKDAMEYCSFTADRMYRNRRLVPAAWNLMGLMNLGYTYEEVADTPWRDLNFRDISDRVDILWAKYFRLLAEQEKINFTQT